MLSRSYEIFDFLKWFLGFDDLIANDDSTTVLCISISFLLFHGLYDVPVVRD